MLDPEYLAQLPEPILRLWRKAEQQILADMARRISTYDYWIPAADHQSARLRIAGRTQDEILSALAPVTRRSEAELRQMMIEAGSRCLAEDAELYRAAGLDVPDPAKHAGLTSTLNTGYQQTAQTMRNLTRSTARTATQQFERVLDRAWLQVNSGAFDYDSAIRGAIKDLSEAGISAIRYPSGRTDSIETAIRRAILTGVNQTAGKLSMELADEVGCDLVEVSAHAGARPEHALWQGKIYSRSGKSEKYPDFVAATGYGTGAGLCGWNCRHSFGPYVEGAPRVWTDEKLAELNEPKYEYNGEQLTEYEAEQLERRFDRNIRRWNREAEAMRAAGQDPSEAMAKAREWRARQLDYFEHRAKTTKTIKIDDEIIGRSVGAKARNQEVVDKRSGIVYTLLEGSKLQNSTVFAGKGVRSPLKEEVVEGLCREFGGNPEDWQHAKAIAELTDGDEIRKAEVHWFQADGIGKVKFKVKKWIDED